MGMTAFPEWVTNEGLLTAEEFAEYETYAQLRGLLAVLQSKARLCLKPTGPA